MILLAALGCGGTVPIAYLECTAEEEVLPADAISSLGFSADDAIAWYGDADALEVTWSGRHSRTPPTDVIDVTVGALVGDVVMVTHVPARADVTPDRCTPQDRLELTREATFATADGGVAGAGTLSFALRALAFPDAEIDGVAPEVVLDDARWLEVDRALEASLAPPDVISLWVHHSSWFESAEIVAEGANYGVSVWKCDEQLAEGCLTWR